MVRLAEGTPVILETSDHTEFKITPAQLRAAITPRTRLFILNSPSNPTGSLYTREEIKALGDVCVDHGVLIMSDEIYEKLAYDGAEHVSVAGFSERHYEHTIIVHGLAKAYSMTGWRIGITAAPEPIAKAIDAIQSHSTSNPTSFAQKGAVAALNGPQDHLPVWLAEFARRRAYAWKKLNSIPGISCVNAKGAFYLFPNISGLGLKSMEFCAKLIGAGKSRGGAWDCLSGRMTTSASATPPAWRTSRKGFWTASRRIRSKCVLSPNNGSFVVSGKSRTINSARLRRLWPSFLKSGLSVGGVASIHWLIHRRFVDICQRPV
jgi:hypothetical protein